jgi:hypothetical protein
MKSVIVLLATGTLKCLRNTFDFIHPERIICLRNSQFSFCLRTRKSFWKVLERFSKLSSSFPFMNTALFECFAPYELFSTTFVVEFVGVSSSKEFFRVIFLRILSPSERI